VPPTRSAPALRDPAATLIWRGLAADLALQALQTKAPACAAPMPSGLALGRSLAAAH